MEKQLFRNYSEQERRQMLSDNCDQVEEMDYTVILSEEELKRAKDKLAQRAIEENRILEEKKRLVDEIKERLKPIVEEKKVLLEDIKHGSTPMYGECYKFIEGDEVGYYDPEGNLVMTRSARPDEKQLTIQSSQRTGTFDK